MTKYNRLFVSLMLGVLPLSLMAQDDDMYFVPTKKNVERESADYGARHSTYYSGINRSVDEYNRRGSYYQVLPADTLGSDTISFSGEKGVYPDSAVAEDFALTRRMTRYDGYEPEQVYRDAYREGYRDGHRDSWHSPWYYSAYYPWYDSYWYWRDPWYYSWYDPWYYDRYWYRPHGWYVGYYHYGYHRPYYYGGVTYYVGGGGSSKYRRYDSMAARSPRGYSNGRQTTHTAGTFGGSSMRRGSYGSRTASSAGVQRSVGTTTTNSYGNFGGSRSWGGSSSGGSMGSFGGATRSSGGSFGGGGGGGFGGGFGGSRSVGGSRSSR